MQSLKVSVQREYWEYRKVIIGLPVIFSILVILASLMATMSYRFSDTTAQEITQSQDGSPPSACMAGMSDEIDAQPFDLTTYLAEVKAETPSRFVALYIGLAWLLGLYYLLGSLYRDRRDHSILYWKSLPVSETQNVLVKLLFGVLGFAGVSILIAWLVYSLLWLFGLGAVACVNGGEHWQYIDRVFDANRLLFAPCVLLLCGLLWGAPIFAYVMWVSSRARRMPFLSLLLPPLVLAVLERIIFSTTHFSQFVINHMPFSVIHPVAHGAHIGEVWQTFMLDSFGSLVLGLVIALVLLVFTVRNREHRFEL